MTELNQNKKWYKKTEIVLALVATILPILASLITNTFDKDKKEITITYSNIEPIISEENEIISNLIITYDSSVVLNISKLVIKIKNSGNVSLSKSDFIDGPINMKINYLNSTSAVLQAIKKDDAGQQSSKLTFINNQSDSRLIYLPSLLNAKDEITLEVYLLNKPLTQVFLTGKIVDGKIIGPNPIAIKESNIGYKTFILSLNSFFYNKWFTMFFLVTIFFFTGLSAFFQRYSIYKPEQKDIRGLMTCMALVSGLISIFLISVIVSLVLYT